MGDGRAAAAQKGSEVVAGPGSSVERIVYTAATYLPCFGAKPAQADLCDIIACNVLPHKLIQNQWYKSVIKALLYSVKLFCLFSAIGKVLECKIILSFSI